MSNIPKVRAALFKIAAALAQACHVDPAELLPGYSMEPTADPQTGRTKFGTRSAAEFLGYSSKTLENWRSTGDGPRSKKVGGRHVYDIADLRAFQSGRTTRPKGKASTKKSR